MLNIYNCGIGMVVILKTDGTKKSIEMIEKYGLKKIAKLVIKNGCF